MAELISMSVYKIQPKLSTTGAMEIVDGNITKAISPETLISAENLSTNLRNAWAIPGIYGKVLVDNNGLTEEYYTSQTVAQLVTAAG